MQCRFKRVRTFLIKAFSNFNVKFITKDYAITPQTNNSYFIIFGRMNFPNTYIRLKFVWRGSIICLKKNIKWNCRTNFESDLEFCVKRKLTFFFVAREGNSYGNLMLENLGLNADTLRIDYLNKSTSRSRIRFWQLVTGLAHSSCLHHSEIALALREANTPRGSRTSTIT